MAGQHRQGNREAVGELIAGHRRFLAFLKKRVGTEEAAEEILQAAYLKSIEKGGAIREGDSVVAWFYQLLRNAVVDHYRRRGAEGRALEREAIEAQLFTPADDAALEKSVCKCVQELLPTLPAQYAALLQSVELDGKAVKDVAKETGLTANNAGVKLHRARAALRKQVELACGSCVHHGCVDCTCDHSKAVAKAATAKASL